MKQEFINHYHRGRLDLGKYVSQDPNWLELNAKQFYWESDATLGPLYLDQIEDIHAPIFNSKLDRTTACHDPVKNARYEWLDLDTSLSNLIDDTSPCHDFVENSNTATICKFPNSNLYVFKSYADLTIKTSTIQFSEAARDNGQIYSASYLKNLTNYGYPGDLYYHTKLPIIVIRENFLTMGRQNNYQFCENCMDSSQNNLPSCEGAPPSVINSEVTGRFNTTSGFYLENLVFKGSFVIKIFKGKIKILGIMVSEIFGFNNFYEKPALKTYAGTLERTEHCFAWMEHFDIMADAIFPKYDEFGRILENIRPQKPLRKGLKFEPTVFIVIFILIAFGCMVSQSSSSSSSS